MSVWQDVKGWLSLKAEQAKASFRMGFEDGLRIAEERKKKKERKKEGEDR